MRLGGGWASSEGADGRKDFGATHPPTHFDDSGGGIPSPVCHEGGNDGRKKEGKHRRPGFRPDGVRARDPFRSRNHLQKICCISLEKRWKISCWLGISWGQGGRGTLSPRHPPTQSGKRSLAQGIAVDPQSLAAAGQRCAAVTLDPWPGMWTGAIHQADRWKRNAIPIPDSEPSCSETPRQA